MIGVILAAGMAKRLRPLTDERPKCLLKVGNRTLLERIADAMTKDAGCSELVVVTGYRANMIREYLTEHYPDVKITFLDNADYENNNNIYSLWMASKVVKGQDVLLMDSDILCDPEAVKRIGQQQEPALAVQRHELGEEEIKVIVDADGRITELNKTCNPADAIGESVGIEKMTADYMNALCDELDLMIEKEGLINIFYERA
ncbi:MAG: phosphocholine cytidylyltransferase family protein, partial [Prevotella sp.]|nr:phosphocholine cytidylyltransferase family protein [Prevotella sp.]